MEGKAADVATLLAAGAPAWGKTGSSYESWPFHTPLHLCCTMGSESRRLPCLDLVARAPGVDLDARSGDERLRPGMYNTRETPLILACIYHPAAALRLLELGARPDLADWAGNTARSRAAGLSASRASPAVKSALLAAIDTALRTLSSATSGPANALREEGNAFFLKGDMENAVAKYEASVALLNDPRTVNNIAAVRVRMAAQLGRSIPFGISSSMPMEAMPMEKWTAALPHLRIENAAWQRAKEAASKANEANPRCAKASYRLARTHMGLRDWPRAMMIVSEGLSASPGDAKLKELRAGMLGLGVRDDGAIAHPMSAASAQALAEMRDDRTDAAPCAFCCTGVPLPFSRWQWECPNCLCDLRKKPSQAAMEAMRLA